MPKPIPEDQIDLLNKLYQQFSISAVICTFKREENSPWETGIAICKEIGLCDVLIFDHKSEQPKTIWEYNLKPHFGCIALPTGK